jgi:precorrin-8X/cobalt-precorrin-8 methylmutase
MKPSEIETLSFQIIDAEAGEHAFTPEEWQIVRRMIHTSADFEYMQSIRFHPQAISAGIQAIRTGKTIFTDTQMARSGIRKTEIRHFGGQVECLITDETVTAMAAKSGTTRALAAVEAAADEMEGGIYVVGNAPTALLKLIELIRLHQARPALVIGLPVGFVNAAESKAELVTMDYPWISNVGRKGGSNLAAAVVNALSIMAIQTNGS